MDILLILPCYALLNFIIASFVSEAKTQSDQFCKVYGYEQYNEHYDAENPAALHVGDSPSVSI
jgi:hypothetical protein